MFSYCDKKEGFPGVKAVGECLKFRGGPVYFLLVGRGSAIEIHVSAHGREGKLALEDAGREIILFVFQAYPWCKMLIATVECRSVYNLCKKLGFMDAGEIDNIHIMVVNYGFREKGLERFNWQD